MAKKACPKPKNLRRRILDADDESAKLRAWLGEWSLGGWRTDNVRDFKVALRQEIKEGMGLPTGLVMKRVVINVREGEAWRAL